MAEDMFGQDGEEVSFKYGIDGNKQDGGTMGIDALFVNKHWYLFPKHFMREPELLEFIIDKLKAHHPDLLI